MKKIRNDSAKKLLKRKYVQSIGKDLTDRQKEVIKLLQKKEVLITNETGIAVTCGNNVKRVTTHPFYNLVNQGLVHRQTEWPHNYVLSTIGERIKV